MDGMYAIPKEKYSFNTEQEKLIIDNIEFVFGWLEKRNLPIGEYFDVVIWGFLDAIKDYDPVRANSPRPYMSVKMNYCLSDYEKSMKRSSRRALNDYQSFENGGDSLFNANTEFDFYETVENRELLNRIFYDDICTPHERKYCQLLILGYSISEIAKIMNSNYSLVAKHIRHMRKKLKNVLEWSEPKKQDDFINLSVSCPFCQSTKIRIVNRLNTKTDITYQFICKTCSKRFAIPYSSLKKSHKR